jgi:hypothetical protein
MGVASKSSVNSMKLPNVNVPAGYCIGYHIGKLCLVPCKYSHNCYICNQFHPAKSVDMQGVPFQMLKCNVKLV